MEEESKDTEFVVAGKPKAKQRSTFILKGSAIILALIIYTGVTAFVSVTLYKNHSENKKNAELQQIVPHALVQQGLVNFLDTKTVARTIKYRDNIDKSMLVEWNIVSDFSNTADAKTQGTLKLDYLVGKTKQSQVIEFVAVKSKKYNNDLYFRMIEGNDYTNAPKDWFVLSSSDIISRERKDIYQRDAYINLFGLNKKAQGFDKFKGFNFFLYNNPAFYVITGDMRESPEKDKIASEIKNDKAYVLQDCNNDSALSWCGGSFNTGGMASITSNYATSEGLGSEPGLQFDSTHFWLTANNQTKTLEKLEVGQGDSDKVVITYSQHNQPVKIALPETYIK